LAGSRRTTAIDGGAPGERVRWRRASAPASAANLGPGFDTLALGLALRVSVEVRPFDELSVTATGEGASLPGDASHLAVRVVSSVLGHRRFRLLVHSEIPVGRGLGSSGALAVAAAAAAGAVDPLSLAAGLDGHPENTAASVLGGLVAAAIVDGVVVARHLPLDPALRFVLVVPDRQLSTATARSVLTQQVPLQDAVFNLGRMALLIAGLADHTELVRAAGEDRLHQRARSALFPEAPALLERLSDHGALLATWSGAGPALLAACAGDASALEVAGAASDVLRELRVPGDVQLLEADRTGLVVEELGDT
jgi:homoserine kinase